MRVTLRVENCMKAMILSLVFGFTLLIAHAEDSEDPDMTELDQIKISETRWANLGLRSYSYSVLSIGAFSIRRYKIAVEDGRCHLLASHKLMDDTEMLIRLSGKDRRVICSEMMISALMHNLEQSVEQYGYHVYKLEFDSKYGFVVEAGIHSDELVDSKVAFEIRDFKMTHAK